MWYLILLIILSLIFYFTYYNRGWEKFDNKEECIQAETNAVMPPNIPYDPQRTYLTGGKFFKDFFDRISPKSGKYEFPIPKLLYDGIWDSEITVDKHNNNIETQDWHIVNKGAHPVIGKYGANKFIFKADRKLALGEQVCEKNIFGKPSETAYSDAYSCCLDTDDTLGVIYKSPSPGMPPVFP